MKKYGVVLILALVLSGCRTSTVQSSDGALTGAIIGSSVGSLFGGIIDGPRGDWWGTAIGTIAGAAIGNTVHSSGKGAHLRESGGEQSVPADSYSPSDESNPLPQNDTVIPDVTQQLDVRNIKFVDEDHNLKINPEEHCQLIFEIYNVGTNVVTAITPLVTVDSQKNHIFMSQPVRIERIDVGEGLRYTVSIYSDRKLKSGRVGFNIALQVGGQKPQVVRTFELPCENSEN